MRFTRFGRRARRGDAKPKRHWRRGDFNERVERGCAGSSARLSSGKKAMQFRRHRAIVRQYRHRHYRRHVNVVETRKENIFSCILYLIEILLNKWVNIGVTF